MRKELPKIWLVIKKTLEQFIAAHSFDLSAALSFYVLFSIGPLIYFIALIASIIFDDAIAIMLGDLLHTISTFIGEDGSGHIRSILEGILLQRSNVSFQLVGIVILFFIASSLFSWLRTSVNKLWNIPEDGTELGWAYFFETRFLSFVVLILFSLVFVVWSFSDTFVSALQNYLTRIFPTIAGILPFFKSLVIELAYLTMIIALIFRILPDGKSKWYNYIIGAFFTAVLFSLSKYFISWYLSHTLYYNIYDALGSIMIVFLWFYFSSIIFYLGASFTYAYAAVFSDGILAKKVTNNEEN